MNRSGMLGSGMLDAVAALAAAKETPAASPVTGFDAESEGNTITLTVEVPENASYFYVYYDNRPFTADNLEAADKLEFRIEDLDQASDGRRTMTIDGLKFNTDYCCTVVSANIIGEESAAPDPVIITTKANRAPVITPDQTGDIVLKASGTVVRTFTITEPDGQPLTREFDGVRDDIVELVSLSERSVQLTIIAVYSDPGKYECSITARDNSGEETGVTTLKIPYTILPNNGPEFVQGKEIALESVGSTYVFNPYDCFYDKDNDSFTFTYTMTDDSIVSYAEQENGLVEFTALKQGSVRIAITATDPKGAAAAGGITVSVIGSGPAADGEVGMDIYPNPARDFVKVRTAASGVYDVIVNTASGSTVYSASAAISLDQPHEVDLSGIAPGTYSLVLRKDGKDVASGTFVRI